MLKDILYFYKHKTEQCIIQYSILHYTIYINVRATSDANVIYSI